MPDDNQSPITAARPPVVNPIATATSLHASTLKLKPIIRKSPGEAAKAASENPLSSTSSIEHLKTVTQKLKASTQEVPAQAILRKTGIVSDIAPEARGMTEAQRLAAMNRTTRIRFEAKSPAAADPSKTGRVEGAAATGAGITEAQRMASLNRTSRIELSSAIGAAPAATTAPIKTIRIKRPENLPSSASRPAAAVLEPVAGSVPDVPELPPDMPPPASPAGASPRKTLKISKPQPGGIRPTGKFALKKRPVTPPQASAPAANETQAEGETTLTEVAELPAVETQAAPAVPPNRIVEVSKGLQGWSMTLQFAASVAMGVLVYFLYLKTQLPLYLGGLL